MKRSRPKPRKAGRANPTQYFTYGPLEFNVTRAAEIAADPVRYRPEPRWPAREWIGPLIEINPANAGQTDLSKPVIFATVILEGRPCKLLIDGNHRVVKALDQRAPVTAVVLDLADTLKIVRGPGPMIEQMKRDGQRLGLLVGPP